MASNETVAEIERELRSEPRAANGEKPWVHYLADRILAAHKREIAAKNAVIENLKKKIDEYERQPELMAETAREALRTLKEQDAVIAELRECLKEAVREKCPFTRMSCKHGEQCDYECGTEKWCKALKGSNNATK